MFRKVENKGRYKTAQGYYWHIKSGDKDYLFTESALEEAEKRAQKNPEDIPAQEESLDNSTFFSMGVLTGVILSVAGYFVTKLFW